MDIEKILDQLLMPPPLTTTADSIRNLSGSSLDKSHGSSSGNSSWLSDSSCGCHSPRGEINKSHLVFYRKSILPPLVCGVDKTEMQSYRHKAVEQEQKKLQNSRVKLISRVEAILSSVKIDPAASIDSQGSSLKSPIAHSTACHDQFVHSDSDKENVAPTVLKKENEGPSEEQGNSESNHNENEAEGEGDLDKQGPVDSDSSSSEGSFQSNAYQQSLQNLLHKSMNLSLNDTFTKPEPPESNLVSSSTSTTMDNMWANDTQATVIPTNDNSSSVSIPMPFKLQDASSTSDCTPMESLDTDLAASQFVDSILEEVRSELTTYISFQQTDTFTDQSSVKSPTDTAQSDNFSNTKPKDSDLSKVQLPVKDISKEKLGATDHIDKALDLIENQLTCNSPTKSRSSADGRAVTSSESEQSTPASNSQVTADASQISSIISPETNDLIASYRHVLELHEESEEAGDDTPTMETEVTDKPDLLTSSGANSSAAEESMEKVKATRIFEGRTRSGSYSLDVPSPLLVDSRAEHTVYSVDEEAASETTESSIFSKDVKRKLEMPSDSEESSVSNRPAQKRKGYQKLSREEHWKVLEEEHKLEMLEMQKQHQQQMRELQKKLLQENPRLAESLSTMGATDIDPLIVPKGNALIPQAKTKVKTVTPRQLGDDEKMHAAWCKLSALVKGYLTRQLLGSKPVQNIMQTIKDTSQTILTMQSEDNPPETNVKTIQDASLMDRLFAQLEASLFDFHDMFFATTLQHRMQIISQSRQLEIQLMTKSQERSENAGPKNRLSSATMKSMHRKKQNQRLSRRSSQDEHNKLAKTTGSKRTSPKEVKSKISHIWKTGPNKHATDHQKSSKGSKVPQAGLKARALKPTRNTPPAPSS